mgnify:CR=1 FL=1
MWNGWILIQADHDRGINQYITKQISGLGLEKKPDVPK